MERKKNTKFGVLPHFDGPPTFSWSPALPSSTFQISILKKMNFPFSPFLWLGTEGIKCFQPPPRPRGNKFTISGGSRDGGRTRRSRRNEKAEELLLTVIGLSQMTFPLSTNTISTISTDFPLFFLSFHLPRRHLPPPRPRPATPSDFGM